MNKMMNVKKAAIGSAICVMAMSGIATVSNAAIGVDVSTPNVRVQVGTPAPPPPQVTVVERERVVVRERGGHHDRGKHKGHYRRSIRNTRSTTIRNRGGSRSQFIDLSEVCLPPFTLHRARHFRR